MAFRGLDRIPGNPLARGIKPGQLDLGLGISLVSPGFDLGEPIAIHHARLGRQLRGDSRSGQQDRQDQRFGFHAINLVGFARLASAR